MKQLRQTTASFGFLLAVLLGGQGVFAPSAHATINSIAWASSATVSQSNISSTNGSPLIYVPGNPYAAGDMIDFSGTTSASNPFNTTATRYFVIYSSGNNIKVATTYNGTAVNAVNSITAAATATQNPDWLTGANWTGGTAPNDSSTIASFPGSGGGAGVANGVVINGNVTTYGIVYSGNSGDLMLLSGSSGSALYPLTFATSDSSVPKITITNQNYVVFFGNNGATTSLKVNGTQGLIFNGPSAGAITGSGTAATSSNPSKGFYLEPYIDWSGFSGGVQIERGAVQQNNGTSQLPTTQSLTVGNAQTLANQQLAGYNLNGRDCTIDALNGNSLGRIYSSSGQGIFKIGNNNGSGTYAGSIGFQFSGANAGGNVWLHKAGSGTETISGPIGPGSGNSSVDVDAGTLILTAANTYSGTTKVNAGKLQVSSAQKGTGACTVSSGATLDVSVSGTSQLSPGTLTFNSGSSTLGFDNVASTSVAPLNPGTVALNGTVTVNINSGSIAQGTSYPLITWSSIGGAGGFVLGNCPFTATLTTNSTTLVLNVATATTNVWTGANNGNWDTTTTGNWSGGTGLYADGGVAVFDDSATGTTNVTVNQLIKPGMVLFNNSNLSYTVTSSSGNYIDNSSSLIVNGGGQVTLSGPNTYSGGTALSAGQLNINDGGSSSANSAIGTGALTIAGGALDNTSSGDVTLLPTIAQNWNGDFAYVGSAHNLNLGSGAVTLAASRTVGVTNNTLTVGGVIGDGGAGYSLTKTGNGTLALNGVNNFSGGATITAGTLKVGNASALGSGGVTNAGGTLDLNGNSIANVCNITAASVFTNSSAAAAALTANSAVTANLTIGVGSGSITVARLVDTGAPHIVTKTGAGTLTFNGAGHDNLMGVTVNAGTAVFANTGGFTADRGVILNSGLIQLNAVGAGSGKNANLINDTSAPFAINGGTFDLNGWNETVPTVSGTGGVILNNAAGATNTLTVGGDNGTNIYYGSFQNGNGVLALAKTGSGIQTLAGTNTYTGGTTISAGTLQAEATNVFSTAGGDVTVTGTLDLNGFDNAINGLNGAGIVDNVTNTGSATLTVGANGDSGNFSGAIQNTAGTLALTKVGAGAQILSGVNSYAGSTTVSNGTLVIASSLSGAGAVTVNAPGVLNASNSVSIAGAASLVGTNATLSLLDGQINTLTLTGNLTLTSSNVLKFDVSGGSLDAINVSGTFTQTGRTTIYVNALSTPSGFTSVPLITVASGSISAGNFVLGNTLSGVTLSLTSDATHLYLNVTVNAPAQAYWNNHVDTVWSDHSGSTYNWDNAQSGGGNTGALPGAPSAVYFAASGATGFNTTLGADFTIASLEFDAATNVTVGGANALTLNGPITVGPGAGSDTISAGSLILGADQNVNVADSGNTLTISSPISGNHALNVNASYGSGTVVLSGSSSYTGNTTITYGALVLNNPTNTLPDTGAVNINNGSFLKIGTNSDTVGAVTLANGTITGTSGVLTAASYNFLFGTNNANLGGAGAMTVNGTVYLAGNSAYSGGTTISSGTLQLGSGNALGVGSVSIAASTMLDLNGQTINNQIVVSGAGTLANNGATAATVTADATLNNNLTIDTTGGNITTARLIGSAVRTVLKTGANTLTFNGAGHNNQVKLQVQGGTVICANNGGYSADRGFELDYGTVKLAGPGSGGSYPNANLFNDGQQFWILGTPSTFDLNGWNETVGTVYGVTGAVIENNATGTNSTLSVGADNATSVNNFDGILQDGSGVLSITKVGTGVQIFDGSCTYSGNTTINNGQLQISASAASPNSTYIVNTGGGLLFYNDTAYSLGGLSGAGNVSLANASSSAIGLTVGANNATTTYSGVLSETTAGSTLTKIGTGTLTLSGANTYTGLTTVSNGVLVISPNYVAGYNFTVNEGAVLGVSANTAITSAQIGTLGTSGSGNSALLFQSLPYPNNAPLTVSTLNPTGGAGSVIISNTAALSLGTYNLVNYTNLTGTGFSAFMLAPLPPGVSAYLTNNTSATPNVIQLVVTAIAPQVWSGAVNGNWDVNATANWKLNGVATNYVNAEPVLFDDTVGGGQTAVNLLTNVQPNSVTVSNNVKNYTFSTTNGSGINALDGFVKNGVGTLTLINLTNSFAGTVTINAGTVVLASSTLGSSAITDDSSLVFSNSTQLVSNTIAGTGSVTQTGGGSVELSGQNAYGDTKILNGTVQSDTSTSLGNGTVTLGDGASANNATLQAVPNSANLSNSNAVTVAAGGSGVYTIQDLGSRDYNLYGNIALNNALTLKATSGGALFVRGSIVSGSSNPTLTIGGGGTVNKFVGLYGDNSSTFTGNIIVTNGGDLKTGLANTLTAGSTITLDSTSAFDTGTANQTIAGLNDFGAGGGTVYDNGVGLFLTLGGSGSYSFSGVITLTGGLIKSGSGTQTLSGTNTYTGPTVVNSGTLLVNGSLAAASVVNINGGTLGGAGTIGGAVTNNSGGTLSPGASIGTLTINNNLTLNAGSTNTFEVNGSTPTNDVIAVSGNVTYGGVLKIVPGGTFSLGQQFRLFYGSGATNTSNFANIEGSPGGGNVFSFTNGVLSVVGVSSGPTLTSVLPNPLTGSSYPVPLSLAGSGFVSGCTVNLTNLTTATGYNGLPATFNSGTSLSVAATLGTAASTWNATVVNPDTTASGQVGFTVSAPTSVQIGGASVNSAGAGKVVLNGTGGTAGYSYVVLSATNLNPPVAWTPVVTNVFDGSGNFAYTNTVNAGTAKLFLRIQQ